ncbi:acetyl esterase/lipase [Murinocardiopsis flavida]|uniref:Acetyl esterase/lipase n=1 Tax=Murinocardiopsis flavida TaxID=645275 RepID=A0A2P8DUG8_9ACTN|nr:alpha/beta hydrolase fold domain-containing protein [Murinocardiopsis flavida]PSL00868.1 acetyl esterase/lipase [Murinocardiopsis flavida]
MPFSAPSRARIPACAEKGADPSERRRRAAPAPAPGRADTTTDTTTNTTAQRSRTIETTGSTTTRIPVSGAERTAVRDLLTSGAVFAPAALPDGVGTEALLPGTGGVPCEWVDSGRTGIGPGVLVYVHGGGFEYADPATERVMAYRLSCATGRPALRVDYRLAPRHPFPAAVEDVVAVYRSLLEQGVPASRILLVGESAGATLLLSALLVLKDAGTELPAGAVPVSALTDLAMSGPSLTENEGKDLIGGAAAGHIVSQYLAGAAPDRAPQSPLYGDLRGLPPLLLPTGGDEVFRDDAGRFAAAAAEAGVDAALDVYEGMPHAFHAVVLVEDVPRVGRTFLARLAAWADRLG